MAADRTSIAERIREIVLQGPPLRLAILFGSAARGRLRPDSDLDLAILPRDDLTLADELELQRAVARACGREVDLVRLDQASTVLRWQIARHGEVVLADPPVERVRFFARAASDYADLRPALVAASRRLGKRLLAAEDGRR
jgi:predicted nucleotidyltransferase